MASNSDLGSTDFETSISTSDVELLKRAWRNEKAAPEILQYEGALVERAKEQIELVCPQPYMDTFVVCRSKNFVSLNLYEEKESPETVEMEPGDLYFIHYNIVKRGNRIWPN